MLSIKQKEKDRKLLLFEEIEQAEQDAEEMSAGDVAKCMAALYDTYTFTRNQVDMIVQDRKLFKHFVKLDALIKNNAVHVRTTPTRYVASILFNPARNRIVAN